MCWNLPLLPGWYVVLTASISRAGKENPLNPTGHINPSFLDDLPSCCLRVCSCRWKVCYWSCRMFRGRFRLWRPLLSVRYVSGAARGNLRFSLFWDVAWRIVVVGPRRFWTTCRFCIPERSCLGRNNAVAGT